MNKKLSHSPLYVYPAVFTPEPEGGYFVHFPDIENCFTCGDTLEEGIMMAEEALALMVYSNYEAEKHIVNIKVINHDTGINRIVSPIIARLWIYY